MLRENRKTAYWFTLLASIFLACGVAMVAPTRAHYQNYIYLDTVVPARQSVTSDCLVAGGQTILLGEIEETTPLVIQFETDLDVSGQMDCYLVDSSQEAYLDVVLAEETVTTVDGAGLVDLFFIPTESAANLDEDLEVDVFVSFTEGEQMLYATFRVTLPGVAMSSESGEETDGSGSEDMDSATQAGDDAGSEDNTESGTGTESAASAEEEGTSGGEETQESEELLDETTEEEASSSDVIPVYVDLTLDTLALYSKEDWLPIYVGVPEGAEYLEVRLLDVDADVYAAFPAYTRYSVDGGNSWTMIYFGGIVYVDGEDLVALAEAGNYLLLDFSATDLEETRELNIQAMACTEVDLRFGYADIPSMSATTELSESVEESSAVLTLDAPLAMWEPEVDGERRYTLEQLVLQEDGTVEYEFISDELFSILFENDTVYLYVGEELPAAGTYRLCVEYFFDEICFAQSSHTFFVNYSENG